MNHSKYALVFGATTHIGKIVSKILLKYGYSVILVDTDINKLNDFKAELITVFPNVESETQKAEILNIDFSVWRDSTTLEHKIREIIDI